MHRILRMVCASYIGDGVCIVYWGRCVHRILGSSVHRISGTVRASYIGDGACIVYWRWFVYRTLGTVRASYIGDVACIVLIGNGVRIVN